MNENFDAFDDYAMQFDMNDPMTAYKYNHSYRVVHQAEEIARSLKLDEDDKELASLIGLLHDVGRFKQLEEYSTFNDYASFDHGDYGAKVLFEDGLIKNFKTSEDNYSIIEKAIRNHNKMYIEDGLSIKEKLHAKIIRDADKIDILYAFSTNRLLEIKDDDSEIDPKIEEAFMKHELVSNKDIKTKNEKNLQMLALVYDLNYDYSKERIYDEKYLEKMLEGFTNKDLFKKFVDEAIKYLEGEIKKC